MGWREAISPAEVRATLDDEAPLGVDFGALDQVLARLTTEVGSGETLSACVQLATVLPILRSFAARHDLAGEVADRLIEGTATVALAATEADLAGDALLHARTRLTDDNGSWRLVGAKEWITNATSCNYALVLARHADATHFTSFSWVLLPTSADGVTIGPAAVARLEGSGLGHLRFRDVAVDPVWMIGTPGRALAQLTRQLSAERLAGALWARSACRNALQQTVQYLSHRETGSGTRWCNSAIRARFTRCLVRLTELDSLCRHYVTRPPTQLEAMALKVTMADVASQILGECADLQGAAALREGGIVDLRSELAMFAIAGGATGSMLEQLAEHADDLLLPRPRGAL